MILGSLRINQLGRETADWYLGRYLPAMDRLDLDAYAAFLADGIALQFNNGPPVQGKPAVTGMLRDYWRGFTTLEHEPLNIYGTDRHFMLEALNHYRRHDGRRVTTSAVALTDRDAAGLVTSVRIYADASPVFQD